MWLFLVRHKYLSTIVRTPKADQKNNFNLILIKSCFPGAPPAHPVVYSTRQSALPWQLLTVHMTFGE